MSLNRMHDRLQAQCRLDTPLGPMCLAATARGLAGAWFDGQAHHPGPLAAPEDADHPHLRAGVQALQAYWQGSTNDAASDRSMALASDLPGTPAGGPASGIAAALPAVPLDLHGTAFQQAVWAALQAIAPGSTCGYGDIARRIGRPAAVRAVGAAIGRNPVCVLVPCHRVLGGSGALTGYAGGLARKRALLVHEGVALPA